MSYHQIIDFNPAKGGSTPNLCLDNVRRGYGIQNKYGSAWEAWQHTQQHPDRNVPLGVAAPLFYSYTVDLGDGPQNYGHINVQLPDGRVWSDGNYYPSIDAYLANHAPKFVGWGESVNDFEILRKGVSDTMTREQIMAISRMATGSYPGDGFNYDHYTNQPLTSALLDELINEFVPYSEKRIQEYASLQAQVSSGAGTATVLKPGTYKVN